MLDELALLKDYPLEFEYTAIINETEKAWQLKIEGYKLWLPKSQCKLIQETKSILIPEWLASQNNLV